VPLIYIRLPFEEIQLDPQGIKRVMDVDGPSALHAAVKIPKKAIKHKSDKDKLINKPTKLTKQPRHTLRSPQSVDPDSSSPENSEEIQYELVRCRYVERERERERRSEEQLSHSSVEGE
jgi:hypothetical protein